ncbi:MAG: hypothetical protein KA715_11290 [Xanthomonadaceae bacterium]|nr:hypothetical protein [Xanthomonadaceae bacterium]
MIKNKKTKIATLLTIGLVMGMTGCNSNESPVEFSIGMPDVAHVEFDAKLKRKYGIGISGEFDLPNVGVIKVIAETPTSGFGLGLNLDLQAFVRSTFGAEYSEVNTLPTGIGFPDWMPGPLIDVTYGKFDSKDIKWHFYFGVRGPKVVGVTAVLNAINEDIPSVNIGYVFYDKKGNVVLGVQFYGPKVVAGTLVEHGGILIGTNLSPLLPAGATQATLSADGIAAVSQALSGGPVKINGRTVTTNVTVSGSGARKIKSKAAFNRLMRKFIQSTQN